MDLLNYYSSSFSRIRRYNLKRPLQVILNLLLILAMMIPNVPLSNWGTSGSASAKNADIDQTGIASRVQNLRSSLPRPQPVMDTRDESQVSDQMSERFSLAGYARSLSENLTSQTLDQSPAEAIFNETQNAPASGVFSTWIAQGSAQVHNSSVTLVPLNPDYANYPREGGYSFWVGVNDQGAAWNPTQIDLRKSFAKVFTIYPGYPWRGPTDGMVFVLQNQGTSAIESGDHSIGYSGMTGSLGVEISYRYPEIAIDENGVTTWDDPSIKRYPIDWHNYAIGTLAIIWNATTHYLYVMFNGEVVAQDYHKDIVNEIFGGNPYVWYGFTTSTTDYTNEAYVWGLGGLSDDYLLNCNCVKSGTPDTSESQIFRGSATQGSTGDPINTRIGNLDYSISDLSFVTPAGTLAFQRSYSSLASGTNGSKLGYGWTDNQNVHLFIDTSVTLIAQSNNKYQFNPYTSNGVKQDYSSYPGVLAKLVKYVGPPVTYQLTDSAQTVYLFDDRGRLLSRTNANGHALNYQYEDGRLSQITVDNGPQYLAFTYDEEGRIQTVTDPANRSISYAYDSSGNLTTFVDVLGYTWQYVYDADHRLTEIIDPTSTVTLQNTYDTDGRVTQQFGRDDLLVASLTYNTDGSTTIENGQGQTHTDQYDDRKTLVNTENNGGGVSETLFDQNFQPIGTTDPLGNLTSLAWGNTGANLEQVITPGGGITSMTYGTANNLTSLTDPNNYITTYQYADTAHPTLMTSTTDALGQTTSYSYSTDGFLETVTDPLGMVTTYTNNAAGQPTSITGPDGQTTTYTNDIIGRMQSVTGPSGRTDWSCYDAASRVIRSVANASGDGATPTTDPCDAVNYQPSGDPQYDRISSTVYDVLGNVIGTTDANGIVTRTFFDAANRPEYVVYNLTGQSIAAASLPTYNPASPDQNRITQTVYDNTGNVLATINPEGVITRTWYDANNRPETVVQNLVLGGLTVQAPASAAVVQAIREVGKPERGGADLSQNIRTDTYYDAAGNAIGSVDPLGVITRTYYDGESRPVKVVRNLTDTSAADVEAAIRATDAPAFDPAYPDRNVPSQTVYDLAGNAIATIVPGHDGDVITRTYYDALNRPITVIQNLTDWEIGEANPPTTTSTDTVSNLRSDYFYDAAGNQIATIDPAGVVSRTYFDDSNHSVLTVQNLTDPSVQTPEQLAALIEAETPPTYSTEAPDWNVPTASAYDNAGNQIATTDARQVVTRTFYNALQQPVSVVQNLTQPIETTDVPEYNPAAPDQNVRSDTVYDSDGRRIASLQSSSSGWRVTRTYYDALNRVTSVVQNLTGQSVETETPPTYDPAFPDQNLRTDYSYDGAGNQVATKIWDGSADGLITRTYYDRLNRVVSVVKNLTGQAISNPTPPTFDPEAPDQNIRTDTQYDASGNVVRTIDTLGHITVVCYDGLYRQVKTVQNPSVSDPCSTYTPSGAADQDLQTATTYDAPGNRLTAVDPQGQTTTYDYDDLNRVIAESDPLSHVTSYSYDRDGRQTGKTDANGVVTKFEYGNLGWLTAVVENYLPGEDADSQTNVRTEYRYDALGNRMAIQDGLGHVTQFTYDALGRQLTETDALDHTTTYTYDAQGNRTSLLDANGATTTYEYDAANRQIAIDPPGDEPGVTYSYDALGNMATMQDATGATAWTYDRLGRPTAIQDPQTGTVGYSYDGSGNRASITYPDGKQVAYQYDQVGRMAQVTDWADQVTTYTYDKSGRPATANLPNGVVTTYSYDDAGHLTRLAHTRGMQTLSSYDYLYDSIGNRTQATETMPPQQLFVTDGFESGDLQSWIPNEVNGQRLEVDAAAAILGAQGLEVHVADQKPAFVSAARLEPTSRYRARFYIDPYYLQMAEGDAFTLFQATGSSGVSVMRINLGFAEGEYQVQATALFDDGSEFMSDWTAVSARAHALEFDWQAATADGSNDGYLNFWVDGNQTLDLWNIDNDGQIVTQIHVGAVEGIDTTTTDVLFLDGFASSPDQYLGLDPDGPLAGEIFKDGFESGTLGAWSGSQGAAGSLVTGSQAAILGSYGLQASITGNQPAYLIDNRPTHEKYYHARFYFNPYDIQIAADDRIILFQGLDQSGQPAFQIVLQEVSGHYQVRAESRDDAGETHATDWTTIASRMHAIEGHWQAAWDNQAFDGYVGLWIDAEPAGEVRQIDNDTFRIETTRLGIANATVSGTQGSLYMDGFKSVQDDYIGLEPDGPSVAAPDAVFSDSFEGGDSSAWSAGTSTEGGLSVSDLAALAGDFGLLVTLGDGQPEYLVDNNPAREKYYRARFYIDPHSVQIADGDRLILFQGLTLDGQSVVRLEMQQVAGVYQLRAESDDNSGSTSATDWVPVTDQAHVLELQWSAAWEPEGQDGHTAFWVDNQFAAEMGNIANGHLRIDVARLGVVEATQSRTQGVLYLDAFASTSGAAIGLDPNGPPVNLIFRNGFEGDGLSAWSASQADDGDLSVTTAAAMLGSQGLQAVLDGDHSLYVSDALPAGEAVYQVRFYFDPNHVQMAEGDSLAIFQGLSQAGSTAFQLVLHKASGHYQIGAEIYDDENASHAMSSVAISDRPHVFELRWEGATSETPLGGRIHLWVDGQEPFESLGWIANETLRIDEIRLGVMSGASSTTSGSLYFDGFVSTEGCAIGLDPAGPSLTPADEIFTSGFESGDTGEWSSSQANDGALSVSSDAALEGSYGLQASIDWTAAMYVVDDSPLNEPHYRARFSFDPNQVVIGNGVAFPIFQAANLAGETVVQVELTTASEGYAVRAVTVDDDGNSYETEWQPLTDAAHTLEIDWRRATAEDALDGSLDFSIDGTASGAIDEVGNFTRSVSEARLGMLDDSGQDVQGTIYFDSFASWRTTAIALAAPAGRSSFALAKAIAGKSQAELAIQEKVDRILREKGLAWSGLQLPSQVAYIESSPLVTPGPDQTVITYQYDPLGRLTEADYSAGSVYAYTYDAVGNRLTQSQPAGSTVYTYDNANRLATVNGVGYTWDDNGNMLSDGTATYNYDYANRLVGVVKGEDSYSYQYNGLGNRASQTVNGVLTRYTMDLNLGLTQVLAYRTGIYVYGNARLAQVGYEGAEYFLGDASGSVRQLADTTGAVTMEQIYDPYGSMIASSGSGKTTYGFTGELTDSYNDLIYLRSRYYSSVNGRFLAKDSWEGNYYSSQTLNKWVYVNSNPINYKDPSGKCYGYLEFLRQIPYEDINCSNLDKALVIINQPNASDDQKRLPYAYLGAWGISHAYLLAGIGLAGYAAADAVIAWAGPYLTYALTRYPLISGGINLLGTTFEAYLIYRSIICKDRDAVGILTAGYITTGESSVGNTINGAIAAGTKTLKILQTSLLLDNLANEALETAGSGSGALFGTRVHSIFKGLVGDLGRADLFSEVNYRNGIVENANVQGSVRLDVVFGSKTAPIAVFDLKTGTAELTSERIAQIRINLPEGYQNIPIIEIPPYLNHLGQ